MPWGKLRIYPDSILRQRSAEVEEITDEVRAVIQDLSTVAGSRRAVGCAAVQLGALLRIFAVCIDDWRPNGEVIPGELKIYINPILSDRWEETSVMDEACLSLPQLSVPVERPVGVTVDAINAEGNPFHEELEGFPARVVMHENDHLNGVLTIDRLPKRMRREYEPQLRLLKKQFKQAERER